MGHYDYFGLPPKLTTDEIDGAIRALSVELWSGFIEPELLSGLPLSKEDNRRAKWAFMVNEPGWSDAAFSLTLVYDEHGTLKLECKMPVSDQGKQWQKEIRKALVKRLWGRE